MPTPTEDPDPQLYQALGRLEGKVDTLLKHTAEHRENQRATNDEQDIRINSLEKWRSFLAGAWALLLAGLTALSWVIRETIR